MCARVIPAPVEDKVATARTDYIRREIAYPVKPTAFTAKTTDVVNRYYMAFVVVLHLKFSIEHLCGICKARRL